MNKGIKKVMKKEIWDYVTEVLDLEPGDKIKVRKEYRAYDDGFSTSTFKFVDKYYVVGDGFLKGTYEIDEEGKFVRVSVGYFTYEEILDCEVTKLSKTKDEIIEEISSAIEYYNDGWEVDWRENSLKYFLAWDHNTSNAVVLTTTNSEVPGAIYISPKWSPHSSLIREFSPNEWAIYLGITK